MQLSQLTRVVALQPLFLSGALLLLTVFVAPCWCQDEYSAEHPGQMAQHDTMQHIATQPIAEVGRRHVTSES